MRWNLLHEVQEINRGCKARATAQWPEKYERPEFLILEMMAQTAGLIFGSLDDFQTDIVFAKVDKAQFYRMVPKTSALVIQASAEELRPEGGWFQIHVTAETTLVADARLLLANAGHLMPDSQTSVTFHKQFMTHYRIREKVNFAGIGA